jgi:short-subunit dehydrogenase
MNKFAVVTGASSGIGLEFAKILASKNYDLLICSRDKKELDKIATKLQLKNKIKVDVSALDLSDTNSVVKLWSRVKDKKVDVFINNAGFGDLHQVVDADANKLVSMINLNVTSLTLLSKHAAEHMVKNKNGKILNVASIAAFFPGPGMAVYYATKAYVLSFSEALSEELKGTGVSVSALCPGPTKTHFAETADADKTNLFSGNIPTASEVARYGIESMENNKVVAIHGIKNKIQVQSTRIVSRAFIRKLVKKIQN